MKKEQESSVVVKREEEQPEEGDIRMQCEEDFLKNIEADMEMRMETPEMKSNYVN